MLNAIKLKTIYLDFIHQGKYYVIFTTTHTAYEYLYFTYLNEKMQSIFYGENLLEQIQFMMKKSKNLCIECQLGSRILGGVSSEGEDLVEFNFTKSESNLILNELKKSLNKKNDHIMLFE